MLYDDYMNLAAELNESIRSLQAHPDANVREHVEGLLQRIDLLHREGLVRLVDGLRSQGAGDALERAGTDPMVRILLGLYDLLDIGLDAREASTAFIPLQQLKKPRSAAVVRRDIDETLR